MSELNARIIIESAIKNRALLFKVALKHCEGLPGAALLAKDCVNDAVEKASRTWSPEGGVSAKRFLAMQVFQHAMKQRASKHNTMRASVEPCDIKESDWRAGDVVPRGFATPEQVYLSRERMRLVNEALEKLATHTVTTRDGEVKPCKASRRAAVVFELVKFDGMTTAAAGEVLGVSQPSAHRALTLALDAVTRYVAHQTA